MSATTDWVQALSAAVGVFGLGIYAYDTRRILKATQEQQKAAQRPFFLFYFETFFDHVELQARNVGPGIAVKFCAYTGTGKIIPGYTENAVVPQQVSRGLMNENARNIFIHFRNVEGVRITFEDLAGVRYWASYKERDPKAKSHSNEQYILEYGEEE